MSYGGEEQSSPFFLFSHIRSATANAVALVPMIKARRLLASFAVWLLAAAFGVSLASAQAPAADTVLISNSHARVTFAEYEAELRKLPADLRIGFANSSRRVHDLLTRMLVQNTLAAQARAAKLDASPEARLRIELEVNRALAQLMAESVETQAAAEFDASRASYEVRARELFLIDRAKFATPAQVSATHILFDTKKHGADEARKLADQARTKIIAGTDMAELARTDSDDPSASTNGGSLGWFAQKDMDPAFAAAAFALQKPGDVSEPVLSQFGWHVIRLDGKRPARTPSFDEARDTIMAELKKRYVDGKREAAINAIRRDPQMHLNREAVDALTPKVDIDEARRRLGLVPGGAAPATAPR
ncbi:MAG: peptidylprolyl isomerase [Burkholderiales bacterium]|nr:peptidylprolyl isomerase [Burkholderiales bacterium]